MSRWADRRRADDGFTLIEVMVAMAIVVVVATATVPLAIGAIRAGYGARLYTQAKNLAQQQVESMRNLQYHIDAAQKNGARRDLLDFNYPGLTPPAPAATDVRTAPGGWVAATTSRAAGEPALGSFYRVTKDVGLPGNTTTFHEVIDTQFVSSGTDSGGNSSPVNPSAGYSSTAVNGLDAPASNVVGVTVFVSWSFFGQAKLEQTYTRIDSVTPQRPLTTSQAQVSAIDVRTQTDPSTGIELIAGQVNADGSSAVGSLPNSISSADASVNAVGARATLTPGATSSSPASPLTSGSAPQVSSVPSASDANGGGLGDCSNTSITFGACYGQTSTVGGPVTVTQGQPGVGVAGSPITAGITGTGAAGAALTLNNGATVTNLGLLPGPQVRLAASSSAPQATGGVSISTSGGAAHAVVAAASACFTAAPCAKSGRSSGTVVEVLPTSFAPDGVVQIQLVRASLTCTASGAAPSAVPDYLANVSYWNGSGYTPLPAVKNGNPTDPLPDPGTLTVTTTMHLSDYLSSWSSALGASVSTGADGNSAGGSLGGVVTLQTQPTRAGDATSQIDLKVGVLACYALDNR